MKVLGFHLVSLHKKATAFGDTGRSTKNGKPKIPIGIVFNVVSLSWSHVPLSDDLFVVIGPVNANTFLAFPFLSRRSWFPMDVSETSSTRTSSDPDEYDPMLELLCHAHMAVFTEALLDEEVGRIALSCHDAPDIPCDKDEVHRLEDHFNRHYSRTGIMLVSSVCGHELYFWCALCNSGESATQWTQSLVALSNSVHDVYVQLASGRSCHQFWY